MTRSKQSALAFMAFVVAVLWLVALVLIDARPMVKLSGLLAILILIPIVIFMVSMQALSRFSGMLSLRLSVIHGAAATVLVLVVAYLSLVALLDSGLAGLTYDGVYDGCRKVWATRGLVVNDPGGSASSNTVTTIQRAFDHGAVGTEVDVFYDVDSGRFVVSHDRPYQLNDGRLLTLEELFAEVGIRGFFWLDLKRLGPLTSAQSRAAAARLEEVARMSGVPQGKIYVEGEDPLNLGSFRDAGFRTIFDTHPLPDDNVFSPLVVNLYKAAFYLGRFSVMAMAYGEVSAPVYGPATRRGLGGIPIFVYHVPDDRNLLAELSSIPEIRVIIDQDHSADHYGLDSCRAGQ
jgi:hypothetical protein